MQWAPAVQPITSAPAVRPIASLDSRRGMEGNPDRNGKHRKPFETGAGMQQPCVQLLWPFARKPAGIATRWRNSQTHLRVNQDPSESMHPNAITTYNQHSDRPLWNSRRAEAQPQPAKFSTALFALCQWGEDFCKPLQFEERCGHSRILASAYGSRRWH